MSFKEGDTVRLKSGGPLMTVESVGPIAIAATATRTVSSSVSKVQCVWFEGKKLLRNSFLPNTLEADDGMPMIG